MEILVMAGWDAVKYNPDKKTYAIRIFHSKTAEKDPLVESGLYAHVAEYTFDDNDTHFKGCPFTIISGPKWLDEETAKKMLEDFARHREGIECLLVHCGQGMSRSPAVAMALNEIFGLGQDAEALREKYSDYNMYVYQKLKDVAEKIGIRAN
jgi:predicted protein tyrosine phosphatase